MAASLEPSVPDIGYVPTVPTLINRAAELFGDSDFMVLNGKVLSFAEADRRSSVIARRLLALGLQKGGRVGLMVPNTLDWVVLFLGITRAGGVAVLMSTLYKGREISEVARQTDIDTLIVADSYLGHNFVERVEQAFPLADLDGSGPLFLSDAPHLRRWQLGGVGARSRKPRRRPLERGRTSDLAWRYSPHHQHFGQHGRSEKRSAHAWHCYPSQPCDGWHAWL